MGGVPPEPPFFWRRSDARAARSRSGWRPKARQTHRCSQLYLHLVALDLHAVGLHTAHGRQRHGSTRTEIEASAVTRTLDLRVPECTVAKRPAIVSTYVVESQVLAADVRQRQAAAVDLED